MEAESEREQEREIQRCYIADLEDGGRGHEPKQAASPEEYKERTHP